MTAQSAASTPPAAVPAPAAPADEVAMVNAVDPEKAKQLTQAVTEQVRSGDIKSQTYFLNLIIYHIKIQINLRLDKHRTVSYIYLSVRLF